MVDCLGDLGGLIDIIIGFAALLIHPITYHSYILNVIKKMFYVHTTKTGLFKPPSYTLKGIDHIKKENQLSELIGINFKCKCTGKPLTVMNKSVNLRTSDSIKLFFTRFMPCLNKTWSNQKVYQKIFTEGESMIR